MTAPRPREVLAPQHQRLIEASAIASEVAAARGYRTIHDRAEIQTLGFVKSCTAPGLLVPIHGVDATIRTYQYRPDSPRLDSKGRPRKYEFPFGQPPALDIPPAVQPTLADPHLELWITEGARKADAAVSAGLNCISLCGVWNWRGTNSEGGKTALPDWESIALNGRTVNLCFDSDVTTKPEVQRALSRLAGFLEYRRAHVRTIYLPAEDGDKVGLDDFLVTHSVEELRALTDRPATSQSHVTITPPKPAPQPPAHPRTLAEVEATFEKWIRDEDHVPTRAVLASYLANRRLDGDPVWLMLVGGSGVGKTERLAPLGAMADVVLESSITGPAALLSATSQKERARDATGGLLRKLPAAGGVLVLKDFTSIIDMHRDARAEVLAALREVFDGRWDRSVGTDGGRTLTWTGRLGLIAGCTTAIDSAHAVISTMGTRFVLVRLEGGHDIADSALSHVGHEVAMRDELRDVVRGLLEHPPGTPRDVEDRRHALAALGSYVARARSPVDRDQQGEIRLVLDPEAPTRVVKMLAQIWRATGLLGLSDADAWELVRRVGFDSIPKLRRTILRCLEGSIVPPSTTDVAEHVEHPTRTTRRSLEDLTAHRVVRRLAGGEGKADRWELTTEVQTWLDATLPVSSESTRANPESACSASYRVGACLDDKTGKVTPGGAHVARII